MPRQVVIIGSGIIGLHVANIFCERGDEVYVLDQAPYFAEHTSGRNSGVIHAGIYYTPGSLKEKHCLAGRPLTYEWVKKLKVPYSPFGKWVMAGPNQLEDFDSFLSKLENLKLTGFKFCTGAEVKKMEPALRPAQAVFIPQTGVLAAGTYVKNLAQYVTQLGCQILLNCQVTQIDSQKIYTTRGEMDFEILINAAGLESAMVAEQCGVSGYSIKPCRGDYYVLHKNVLQRPVYHLPGASPHGLGVHLTPNETQTLFGPNDYFIKEHLNYHHGSPPDEFKESLKFYLPEFADQPLHKGMSGNRPKLFYNDVAVNDFCLVQHDNTFHFLGIESPGLTSAPSLAKTVLYSL